MTKRWLVAPLVLGFIVVACGGDDAAEPTEAATPTVEPTEAATPTVEPTEAAQTAEATEAAQTAEATEAAQTAEATEAAQTAEATAGADSSALTAMLGDEEIAVDRVLCYFEEQPRAGLGGVWTHTLQVRGTNAAGEPVVISLDRARSEEGEVVDAVIVDIGEPGADDAASLNANGPEGLIEFGEASASAQGVEVAEFGSDPVTLSVQVDCS